MILFLIKIRLLFIAGVISLLTPIYLHAQNSVQVYNIEADNGLILNAKNENLFPVTIQVELELENLKPDVRKPYIFIMEPKSDVRIMTLNIEDENESWSYRSEYVYYMGNIYTRHNDQFAYRLPFRKGDSFTLSQGFGGTFSHKDHQEYALDFTMPVGTPVYAARGGRVVEAVEKYTEGGHNNEYLDKANHVTVLHDDGTFADYTHLRANGVEVKQGQVVRTGQLLGYSGATGYVTGPHLHFVVKKAIIGGGFQSIPVKFATKDGIKQLDEGRTYIGY
jgi:murein DD-endopeptidase MepM/ murein hydrolase activator NlpD